jgi:uncharacterized protein YjdB
MAGYSDAQIKSVCDKATEVLHGFTDAQNVTFPTTAIISGMKAGLDADTIANNARAAIDDLPLFNNGTYNTIGSNLVMFNYGSYVRGAVYNAIKELEGGVTPEPMPEPTVVTITSVTLNKNTTSIAKGSSETLTATVVASPDEAENKTVTWSLATANDKVTVVDGVVTVDAEAEAGEVTVVATSTKDNTKSDSCVVTITAE